MRRFSKWVTGIGPGDTVGAVAREIVAQRLSAVAHYVPLAALEPKADVEYVHQLRVWTRRSSAACSVFSGQLPPKRRRWLKKWLRRLRQAAGPARDDDVLAIRLQAQMRSAPSEGLAELLESVTAHRVQAQDQLDRVHDACCRKAVLERFGSIVAKTRWRKERAEPDYLSFARGGLARGCRKFFAAADQELHEIEALHALRIEGKRLRYSIELFAPAFDSGMKRSIYPQIEALQETLGEFNDHAVAAARYRDWRTEENLSSAASTALAELTEQEDRLMETARQKFFAWWNEERRGTLETQLAAYCDGDESGDD